MTLEDVTVAEETPITLMAQYGHGHMLREFLGEGTKYTKNCYAKHGDDSNKRRPNGFYNTLPKLVV